MSRQYQDEWVEGRARSRGYRECAKRYEIVRAELERLPHGFTLLDFGARRGYFSVRLAEDFGARCTLLDYEGAMIERAARKNPDADLTTVVRHVRTADDLTDLGTYDVVLALSVLHHIPHHWPAVLDRLQAMAREVLIVEAIAPGERVRRRDGDDFSRMPDEVAARGRLIGYGPPVSGLAHGPAKRGIYAIGGTP